MTLIRSNAILWEDEYATFIKIPNTKNKFLCIFTNEDKLWEKTYEIGETTIFNNPNDYEIISDSEHSSILKESPLKGLYLFEYFLGDINE